MYQDVSSDCVIGSHHILKIDGALMKYTDPSAPEADLYEDPKEKVDDLSWGQIAKRYMKVRGISTAKLASAANMSYPTLVKYLSGERTQPRDNRVVFRIAEALSLDPKVLIGAMLKDSGVEEAEREDLADWIATTIQDDQSGGRLGLAQQSQKPPHSGHVESKDDADRNFLQSEVGGNSLLECGKAFMELKEYDLQTSVDVAGELDLNKYFGAWYMPNTETEQFVGQPILIRGIGDSMSPTIPPSSRLVVDLGYTRPSPDGIYLLHDGIGMVVKRIERVGARRVWRLISDNPSYDADVEVELTDPEGGYRILGRVMSYSVWL